MNFVKEANRSSIRMFRSPSSGKLLRRASAPAIAAEAKMKLALLLSFLSERRTLTYSLAFHMISVTVSLGLCVTVGGFSHGDRE